MIGRLLRSADFERVLRTRSRASSTHFAVHHLPDRPTRPHKPSPKQAPMAELTELSTDVAPLLIVPVDDFVPRAEFRVWLGAVVPKRHARRSVTRSLLKRQIRAAVGARSEILLGGLWVVRLRAPFDKTMFPSAASEGLKHSAREELDQVLNAAAQRALAR